MKITAASIALILLFALSERPLRAAGTDPGLRQTTEIISALKSNYVDREKLDGKTLDDATVAGILEALGSGATIISSEPVTDSQKAAIHESNIVGPIARAEVIDPNVGYIRFADVADSTVRALDIELAKLAEEKANGFVLDLRFADGTNYSAAAGIASRFVSGSEELFTLKSSENGAKVFHASPDTKSVASMGGLDLTTAPLVILVNAETRGSAEALAGALRARDRGIVIGSKTAGTAAAWKDVKLSDGQVLRLATAKIVLPAKDEENGKPVNLFPNGITPDVTVKINAKVERDTVLTTETNQTLTASLQPRLQKKGLSEAELVKAFRGQAVDTSITITSTNKDSEEESDIQNVHDVVLQRAVDILKGIRVLLSWQ